VEDRRGSVMEAIGTPENLELAAYVYDFLCRSAEQLWLAHQREQGVVGNRDRQVYYAGVMSGFAEKLAREAKQQRAGGLVWVPEARLHEYTRKRHPYLRTVRHQGPRRRDAFQEGQKAGRGVVLQKGLGGHNQRQDTRLLKG
jgi:hypothetical protein